MNDIIDITKIESGELQLNPGEYEIESTILTLANVTRSEAEKKGISFVLSFDENLPVKLIGDELRLRQIISNMLSNAVKYTNEGSISLFVSGDCDERSVRLRIAVEDTGIGIKPEDIPKLTEKFSRIEESRNRNISGTGIGINIISQLLQLMGSELKVESVYGEGSKFSFVLWQEISDSTSIAEYKKKMEERKRMGGVTFPDARILAVDDNKMNLKVLSVLLKKMKVQLDTADGGLQGVELASENKYDLIFMDHMMPEVDGIEAFHRIRNLGGQNALTPVIVLTANAVVGAREMYLAEGFNDYLSKPVEYHILEEMMVKYLGN